MRFLVFSIDLTMMMTIVAKSLFRRNPKREGERQQLERARMKRNKRKRMGNGKMKEKESLHCASNEHLAAGHKSQFSCHSSSSDSFVAFEKEEIESARERIYIYIQFYDMNYCVESTFTVYLRTLRAHKRQQQWKCWQGFNGR